MAAPGSPLLRRFVLRTVVAARSLIMNRLGEANLTAGSVQGFLCVQKRGVFGTAPPKAVWKARR